MSEEQIELEDYINGRWAYDLQAALHRYNEAIKMRPDLEKEQRAMLSKILVHTIPKDMTYILTGESKDEITTANL